MLMLCTGALLDAMRSSKHCCHIWQHKLLCAAVRCSLVKYIQPIIRPFESYEALATVVLLATVAHCGSLETLLVFLQMALDGKAKSYYV